MDTISYQPYRQRDTVHDSHPEQAVRNWKDALFVVKPDTLIRWHRKGFRLFWRWKSRPKAGRAARPSGFTENHQANGDLERHLGRDRIAREFLVKLGIRVSPRTVRKYMPARDDGGRGPQISSQRLATLIRNHATAIVAADFLTVVTARFEMLYVFVVMEVGSRKMLHFNVTAQPSAEWTLQQFREAIPCEHDSRFLIVDRDSKFSEEIRNSVRAMGVKFLRTPPTAPQANAYCERLIGTTRRECLGFLIPLSEPHLRRILRFGRRVVSTPVLGGLHHDYRFDTAA